MRKKSQDELGTLVTREMKVMLQDESLTKEQRFDILSCVMFDAPLTNTLMASFANSLKAGFEQINGTRYKAIDRIREFKRRSERIRRHGGNMDNDKLPFNSIPIHGNPCSSIPIHGELKAKAKQGNISPYKPPKGGKRKVPKAVEPEDILKEGSAAATGSCRFMDAEGFCTNKKNQGGGFKCSGCELRGPEAGGEETRKREARIAAGFTYEAAQLAYELSQTEAFAHMRVNDRSLRRCLLPIVKKNSGAGLDLKAAILAGLAAWTEKWKADDWQYAPGKITKWLADEKWLEKPRKKTAPAEGSGCGDCGAEIA